MVRLLDLEHLPILSHGGQGFDIGLLEKITVAEQDEDRNTDRRDLFFGECQFGEAAETDSNRLDPVRHQRRAEGRRPTHLAERTAGPDPYWPTAGPFFTQASFKATQPMRVPKR